MDAHQFDRMTASLAGTTRRRRLVALLAALPLTAGLRSLGGWTDAEAAHPVDHVHDHQDQQRDHARHRQDHQHKVRTRNNGKKGGGVNSGARSCPDKMLKCCVLTTVCTHGCRGKPQKVCGPRVAGEIGPVGTCWEWGRLECMPCADEDSLDRRCNETFPECAANPYKCRAVK